MISLNGAICIAFGGAAGALARYAVAVFMNRWGEQMAWSLPLGTLVVNLLGSFLFGCIWVLMARYSDVSEYARLLLLTGFMGSFTTFSTFSFETVTLMQTGQWLTAVISLLLNVLGALFAFWLGAVMVR